MNAQLTTHLMRRTHLALTRSYTGAADDEIDDRSVHIDMLVTWNHDWERHVLTQQQLLRTDGGWSYALWHLSHDGFTLVRWFGEAERSPLVEAATIVESWRGGVRYEV